MILVLNSKDAGIITTFFVVGGGIFIGSLSNSVDEEFEEGIKRLIVA